MYRTYLYRVCHIILVHAVLNHVPAETRGLCIRGRCSSCLVHEMEKTVASERLR